MRIAVLGFGLGTTPLYGKMIGKFEMRISSFLILIVNIICTSFDPVVAQDSVKVEWINHYFSPDTLAHATGVHVDNDLNVYVTGWIRSLETGIDFIAIKYNSEGQELWSSQYDNTNDFAQYSFLDQADNLYITGYSQSHTNDNYTTVKYHSDGTIEWSAQYDGPAKAADYPVAIVVDEFGNVIVTGVSYGMPTIRDYATVKYNKYGIEQWVARYSDPYDQHPYDLVLDRIGNIYVTGYTSVPYVGKVFATVKYNPDGIQQWIAKYNESGSSEFIATSLAQDLQGNIFVVGAYSNFETNRDILTIKYDSDYGEILWYKKFNRYGNSYDFASHSCVDIEGNICILGSSLNSKRYLVTIKQNTEGNQKWVSYYVEPVSSTIYPRGIVTDKSGNIYIIGYHLGKGSIIIKYDSNGNQLWETKYGQDSNSLEEIQSIAIDDKENVYVVYTSFIDSLYSITTIKYSQYPQKRSENFSFMLQQNFPNPFNSGTKISYSIPQESFVTLKIYDILGREVATIVNEENQIGNYEINFDAKNLTSGIYFYKLQAGSLIETKKMVLMK